MHAKPIIVLAAALVLFGCSTVNQSTAFNAGDFKPYESPGTAVIRGHAFVRTDEGKIEKAAGLAVYLVPLTPYTGERAKIMLRNRTPAPADPLLEKYVQVVVADVSGDFEFSGLPAGSYVVYSRIEWHGRKFSDSAGDDYVVGEATVAQGEKKRLVVTNVSEQ
jgi:hypothetical protein